jgi:GTPase KRas
MRGCQGFIIVYSITSRKSFDEINEFYEQILRVKDVDTFPMVLVGNKCDLETERNISKLEGKEMAEKMNSPFIEASARARFNVDECFELLIRSARSYNKTNEKVTKGVKHEKKKCLLL